ncbi:hypothetical protein GCM10010981_15510 [Dyella nitratireducens]|uniref:Uncharacterized protein n=1 Tax=Dyella nitratireducens TaxID=1849580 RepID=A0ABQ1FRB7_9GAMM|nr:hypothetical protein GCM10010981_15510 [Dyella nitratireducens]GLQ43384.1 hypothetical protein GCM10007902_32340 [Dyella nitratireducens]
MPLILELPLLPVEEAEEELPLIALESALLVLPTLEMLLMKGLVENCWRRRTAGKAHLRIAARMKALPAARAGFLTAHRPSEPLEAKSRP